MHAATWDNGYGFEPAAAAKAARLAMPIMLLVVAFMMPPETCVNLGPLRLSPYRVILLILVVPSMLHILSGKAGPVNAADFAMLGHSIWAVLALGNYDGINGALQSGGIYFVECFGAYAMGRRYIRSVEDFQAVSVFIAICICILLAFTLPESVTHVHFLRETFRAVLGGPALPVIDPRMGLSRAFGSFEHPILYGVFCSMAFATAWYMARPAIGGIKGLMVVAGILLASFVSLSAGAWVMLGMQIMLIVWERITRGIPGRWWLLIALFILVLVAVSMMSSRSPVLVFISYASFSPVSSYNRVLIWDYGTAEVGRHPLLGIGLGEWIRAPWMSSSMDNFWLCTAVRYGLPALIMLAFSILTILFKAAGQKNVSEAWERCRLGWIITIVGAAIAASTVHLWNNTFGFYLFIVGCGAWLMERPRPAQDEYSYADDDDLTIHEGDLHADHRFA